MKKVFNPNTDPFPRKRVQKHYLGTTKVHPMRREAYEVYFKKKNDRGYQHDLGAQDVFLDNLGILFQEQFSSNGKPQWEKYDQTLKFLLRRWDWLSHVVVKRPPFWGLNLNSSTRQANAGEPRGLLRFLRTEDLSVLYSDDLIPLVIDSCVDNRHPIELFVDGVLLNPWRVFDRGTVSPWALNDSDIDIFGDWSGDRLFGPEWDTSEDGTQDEIPVERFGALLPEDMSPTVDRLPILHPKHSTPDLPLRVGAEPDELALFQLFVRDQGSTPTCVAHAIAVALDVLASRQDLGSSGKPMVRFSAPCIHFESGENSGKGRHLRDAIDVIRYRLPCTDDVFPAYPNLEYRTRRPRRNSKLGNAIEENRCRTTDRFGALMIHKMEVNDVSAIKAHLAAGWVVVVTTALTHEFLGRGFRSFGLPVTPLIGQQRHAAHAWLLIGYEHVDGNHAWKYQGRFIALNSWGADWPRNPVRGAGICTLPFAMLLTEGIEAYALRLQHS